MNLTAAPSVTSAFAFANIGAMLFPQGYQPGFLKNLFTNSAPAEAPHYADTPNYIKEAALTRAQFWADNTHTDYNCTYVRDDANGSSGGFSIFRTLYPYKGENVINPQLIVRAKNVDGTAKNPRIVENSIVHEMVHLRQYLGETARNDHKQPAGADILFASIANSSSPIVLSPRARRIVMRFMEADAAAKTAWMANVAAQDGDEGFLDTLNGDAMSAQRYKTVEESSPSHKDAMRKAAYESMTTPNWGNAGGPEADWTYGDYYDTQVHGEYGFHKNQKTGRNQWNALRLAAGDRMEFVDIDLTSPADRQALLKIGNSCDVNPFEHNGDLHPLFLSPEFLGADIKPAVAAKEDELNTLLGLDSKTLRGYNEALAAWGVKPFEFMSYATGGCEIKDFPFRHDRHVSPLEAPRPDAAQQQPQQEMASAQPAPSPM